jgi:predicted XRE-type DNA-binding protein
MSKYGANIYSDLGIASPKRMLNKAHLVAMLIRKIGEKNLTTVEAAQILNMSELQLNEIIRGHFHAVSASELRWLIKTI